MDALLTEKLRRKNAEALKLYLKKLNDSAGSFVKKISQSEIYPTWGFEVQPYISRCNPGSYARKVGNVTLFQPPEMAGIIFDDKSKMCVYYSCKKSVFESTLQYNYQILSYAELISTKIITEDEISYQSQAKSKNIVGRAVIGSVIAGGIGAVVAGATSPQAVTTQIHKNLKSISLNIQTSNPNCGLIQFIFPVKDENSKELATAVVLTDATRSTFSGQPYIMENGANSMSRQNGTTEDCYIRRTGKKGENVFTEMPLGEIQKRLTTYAQKIEAIILSNQKAPAPAAVPAPAANPTEDKLLKLKSLLEKDLITQEEYQSKKAEVLKDL